MKKFLPLFLFALTLSVATSAQGLRYGVVGAINFDSYSMESADFSIDSDSRVGFRVGFRAEMDAPFIYKGFYFDGEAVLSSKGAEFTGADGDVLTNVTSRPYYLEVPLHIGYKYMFGDGDFGVFASFGPYFGIGLFGTDKYFSGNETQKIDSFSSNNLKRFDFGLGLRGGMSMFDHYRLYVGYDWGLVNISQIGNGVDAYNRNFYIGASYMF